MHLPSQDFSMFAGDSVMLIVEVVDEDGNPKDLTNSSIRWGLRKLGDMIIEKQTPSTVSIIDAVNGVFSVTLFESDTNEFEEGIYNHQARVIDGNGASRIVFSGIATIHENIFS